MSYDTITYDLADDIAVIALNRPDRLNPLSQAMRAELTEAVTKAGQEARCVVLTGHGRAFCSGQDLTDTVGQDRIDFEGILRDEYVPLLNAIYDCPVPTIAAVNGPAAGAGANLALAADVVIASEAASFLQAFTRIGLVPDAGGTYWLPRQIGVARAMGACLFADPISAKQAAEWGMIYEAVPEEGFEAHWRARAAHLAQGPTKAYGEVKKLVRASMENDLPTQLDMEGTSQQICGDSRDFKEGVTAFLQKRKPSYTGE